MELRIGLAPTGHLGGGAGVCGKIRLHNSTARSSQAAVGVSVELVDVDGGVGNIGRHGRPHFTRCSAVLPSPEDLGAVDAPSSATRIRSRARDSRDITVPSGTPSTSAASL